MIIGRTTKYEEESPIIHGNFKPESYIWYQRRQRWIRGPDLPSGFLHKTFCAVPLNDSSAMLIGGYNTTNPIEYQRLVFVYNFNLELWFQFPNLEMNGVVDAAWSMWYCTATLMYDKNSQKSKFLTGRGKLYKSLKLL